MAASVAALSPARAKKTSAASQRAEVAGRVFAKPDPGLRLLSALPPDPASIPIEATRGSDPNGRPLGKTISPLKRELAIGRENDPLKSVVDAARFGTRRLSTPSDPARPHAKHSTFAPDPLNPSAPLSLLAPLPVHGGVLQAKLEIGAVDDPLEREADAMADAVMRMPDPSLFISTAPPQINRKCATCEKEDEEAKKVQTKPAGTVRTVGEAPPIVHDVLRSPGQPLDSVTRSFFEPRFGHDFSRVRVHTDNTAAQSAAAIGAHAYTVGSDIVFSNARFDPNSESGRELIAHELTHVVQQTGQPKVISRDDAVATPTPAPQPNTPSDGVRALASRFEMYAMKGEAALLRAPINAQDANRIRANIAKLRTAIAGMRTVADVRDDDISVTLLASFTSPRLENAAASLRAAAPASPAVTIAETAPVEVAAFKPEAALDSAVEREAQEIGKIIASVAPSSAPSSSIVVMRQALEIEQQVEQQAPVIDQLIDVSTIGFSVGVAANDTVALGALATVLGSPVVVVAAVVVVALLAAAAVWYFWDQSLNPETKKLEGTPPQTGYAAPAPSVAPPSPPPPTMGPQPEQLPEEKAPPEAPRAAGRWQRPNWRIQIDPSTNAPYTSEELYKQGRRLPDQKCSNGLLDDLQEKMHDICDTISGCGGSPKTQAKIPCSVIRASIAKIKECMKRRDDIQQQCFTAVDPTHQTVMAELGRALQKCETLELINCAPGHPMANL